MLLNEDFASSGVSLLFHKSLLSKSRWLNGVEQFAPALAVSDNDRIANASIESLDSRVSIRDLNLNAINS